MKQLMMAAAIAALVCGCRETPAWNRAEAPLELPFESTVVVTGSDVTCGFAVKELNEIVKLAAGRGFMVEKWKGGEVEKCGTTPPPHHSTTAPLHHIFLGRCPEAECILGSDFFEGGADYKSETSCVFAKDGDLYIVGSDAAGTLWAVYDFVEDSLGYRWYQMCHDNLRAENEVFVSDEKVGGESRSTKDGSIFYNGIATRRRPGFDGFRRDHGNWHYFRLFRLRHRSNTEIEYFVPNYRARYMDWRTWGHGFDQFLPSRDNINILKIPRVPSEVRALGNVFKSHPEYFSLGKDGKRHPDMQLCLSSQATRDALWQSLCWWVKKNGKGIYMVGSNDDYTGTYCFCKDCLALDAKYGGQCGALWYCIIDLCNRLKAAKMDGVYITSLAYRHQTQLCPPGLVFPDNFICDYAPVTWDRSPGEVPDETLSDGRVYNMLDNCRAWAKACPGGLSYWYYGGFNPAYTWARMSKELNEVYDAGVRSVGWCADEGGCEFRDLTTHMYFWCLYNPHGDARAEFGRACASKYGPAAEDILAYTDFLEKIRQRIVRTTPCGAGAATVLTFATKEERQAMSAILDRAAEKAKGTKYAENVSWARMSLDTEIFFKDGDAAAEVRARAAATSYTEKVGARKLMTKGNAILSRLDQMAYYSNLKSDALPPELAQYPKEKVHRVLPPKSRAYKGYFNAADPVHPFWTSVPDPLSVCGYAIADELPADYAPLGANQIRIGLYNHAVGRYLIPWNDLKFPKGFWKSDRYTLFCLGRSSYAPTTRITWTDANGCTSLGTSPLDTWLLSRHFDSIILDKQFETWISLRAEGPKFFPGDKRPNKIFIEQMFTVEL